jgi:hypothetical protein
MAEIIGSIIKSRNIEPFIFHIESRKLEIGSYRASWDIVPSALEDKEKVIAAISEIAYFDEIRIGEYFCSACEAWVAASRNNWSVGICFSCSFDRDSEFAEGLKND